jgi:hypothetical protein
MLSAEEEMAARYEKQKASLAYDQRDTKRERIRKTSRGAEVQSEERPVNTLALREFQSNLADEPRRGKSSTIEGHSTLSTMDRKLGADRDDEDRLTASNRMES